MPMPMGGKNTNANGKRRQKHRARLARALQQDLPVDTEAEFARVTGPPAKEAPPASSSTRAFQFLDMMNSRLKRLQKPLAVLLLGNVAVGTYVLLSRKDRPPIEQASDRASADAPSQSASGASHQGGEPVHTHEAHEGPSGTSLVGSGGATLSTPGGTPVPMPSFASSDHHHRHEGSGSQTPHHEREGHGGPSGTSFVGSGGATLSTPGGTPIPLYSQSKADHHLRRGEGGGGPSAEAQRKKVREEREREIELDQNGDPVTRGPPDDLKDREELGGLHRNQVGQSLFGKLEEPTSDLSLEQYKQGLLQELDKRRKMTPISKEDEAWIDHEKEMIKEHLRHMPKSS
ncbi:hypothetical protein KFL_000770200 [Klebsormidium nitens]|uniref:Transmembrane protein n=1 Tax=Klebsormidium nitens TaxID=105231 RepID=A0A1Y1HXR0_KLENI|nr:hypothetical protein KFL_000770200 [Klebsormidium nitens]|eukprot:GAQ81327.1 hypothetical protein KFL_000770200 [Klebsormidium nitens]